MHQEDITLINIYAHNQGAPKYVNQLLKEPKGETDQNTIVVGDLNTPLSDMDRSSKQKINKETISLNDTLDQLDIIDIYRAFYPKTALPGSAVSSTRPAAVPSHQGRRQRNGDGRKMGMANNS